jgi:DNA-binding response OmpR family regulator
MRILVVEDEPDIASFLKKGLEENGNEVMVAFDGEIALRLVMNNPYDMILLDVILPKVNGIEVCRKLRQEIGFSHPIIMLTALGATDDIVDGLNIGADDYLVKPIKFRELLARVNALSRRIDASPRNQILSLSDLELDMNTKEVRRGGTLIQLTAKEFNLLAYLLKNKGRVVSRVDILENVWEVDFDLGTNVIDVYVNYLRKKIDKDFSEKLIHTVVGMGYVLKQPNDT